MKKHMHHAEHKSSAHKHMKEHGHMKDNLKDYSTLAQDNTHYSEPSFYGKLVHDQYDEQPNYCDPGMCDGMMKADHSNAQMGPKLY